MERILYNRSHKYNIPIHEFLRAVIYGDNAHYDPNRSYIANLFETSTSDPREHFILPVTLSQLDNWTGHGIQNGFIETSMFYDRLQGLGFVPNQIDAALIRAHRHKLIETTARRTPELGRDLPPSLRITSVGAYHLHRLLRIFTYVDAIIVDTSIIDQEIREKTRNAMKIQDRLERAVIFCDYLDRKWLLMPDAVGAFKWPEYSKDIRSDIDWIRDRIANRLY